MTNVSVQHRRGAGSIVRIPAGHSIPWVSVPPDLQSMLDRDTKAIEIDKEDRLSSLIFKWVNQSVTRALRTTSTPKNIE